MFFKTTFTFFCHSEQILTKSYKIIVLFSTLFSIHAQHNIIHDWVGGRFDETKNSYHVCIFVGSSEEATGRLEPGKPVVL